jgi:hypothetical protein
MSMTKIQTVNLVSNAANIEFTAIPNTYKDLYILLNIRSTTSGADREEMRMTFNGSSSGYSRSRGYAYDGGTFSGDAATGLSYIAVGSMPAANRNSNVFGPNELYIFSYAESKPKAIHGRYVANSDSSATYVIGFGHYGWSDNSPITSIRFVGAANSIASGSTATLYGIR